MKTHENRDYFEAILQIRPGRKDVIDFIDRELENRPKVFISKVIELKTGLDLYLSCRKFAAHIAKQLKSRFKAKVTISRSLFTQDHFTSKYVYRMTYCARF